MIERHEKCKKRSIHFALPIILLSITLSGCVGLLDWTVYLPENYAIIHVNSQSIVFGRLNENHSASSFIEPIGDSFVMAYCYNDEVIGLCCAADYDKSSSWSSTEKKYYLFEFKSGKTIEFHNQYVIETELQRVMADDQIEWILTRPTPKEAVYPNEKKKK